MSKTLKTAKEYSAYQLSYGLIPLLFVLDYFERHENYEECAEIIKGVEYYSDILGKQFCTRLTEEALIEHHKIQCEYTQRPVDFERYKVMQKNYGCMIFEDLYKLKSLSKEIEAIKNMRLQ